MILSRWRRVATGVAAGVIVLCAALIGGALRSENAGVSVAADLRPPNATPIVIDESEATDPDAVVVIEDPEPLVDAEEPTDEVAGASDDTSGDTATADVQTDDAPAGDAAAENAGSDGSGDAGDTTTTDADSATSDAGEAADTDAASVDTDTNSAEAETPAPAPAPPASPANGDSSLGTGGGVDDAECALDRLVIYAGARVGGVAGSIRNALAQAGFGAGCATPVTVLASNCPLQFAGALGAGSGYDPNKSYVAASNNVDRSTMTSVMGTVGYTGSEINILDFGFVNPDQPGEQWMAIFVPPSFTGWENLAARAGLPTTAQSLCAPSGELAG